MIQCLVLKLMAKKIEDKLLGIVDDHPEYGNSVFKNQYDELSDQYKMNFLNKYNKQIAKNFKLSGDGKL